MEMKERDAMLKPYIEAIPDIVKYQIATKILLGIWLFLLGRLFRVLLNSTGRVAVSSGDFTFLFTSWQGLLIIVIALSTLFMYVALDLNAQIILSRDLLIKEDVNVWYCCMKAIRSIPRLINFKGIGVAIYILLIAPIIGIGFSVTLTKGFYIPTFISSVIEETPLYLILASLAAIFFAIVGIANLFILHGVVIDKLSIKDAGLRSKKIMKENGKDFLNQNIEFILVMAAVLGIIVFVVLILPLVITNILPLSDSLKRGLIIFLMLQGIILSFVADLLAMPLYMMKMTQLYFEYSTGQKYQYKGRKIRKHRFDKYALIASLIALVIFAIMINHDFDDIFPQDSQVKIIAHRAGGIEGAENTVSGLEKAWQIGAYGAEIDIQRTKDGHYILNHDGNFARVAGDNRKPEEMTLAEIKSLSVDGQPIPTFEEMLEASKGKMVLFTELKGDTADRQMADDAVRLIKEYGMEDEVVLISLKYDLINYIETTYPEMQTGYLTFASFGDTALLNCDYLALEEESATADAISAVHKQGKKVLIWTANKKQSQHHFMCSSADAIITDNVSQANEVLEELENRSDLSRIIDGIRQFLS